MEDVLADTSRVFQARATAIGKTLDHRL